MVFSGMDRMLLFSLVFGLLLDNWIRLLSVDIEYGVKL